MRLALAITSLFLLLSISCVLSNRYEIQFDCDGQTIETGGATLVIEQKDDGLFARMTDRDGTVKLAWAVDESSPYKWPGERFRGNHIRIDNPTIDCEYHSNKVGILVEITDVTGRTVSGKFSGQLGFGDNARNIDNGVFRAYLEID